MTPCRFAILALALLSIPPAPAGAQIYRDLDPVDLVYRISLEGETVGSLSISFRPEETERGPRLLISAHREYVLPLATPFVYQGDIELVCDENGLRTFTSMLEAGDQKVKHVGILAGDDYHITTTSEDRQEKKTITSGVRRTNLGHFCAAYLETPIDSGPIMSDWPWLVPAVADHQPRQKVRESRFSHRIGDKRVAVIVSKLRRLDDKTDTMTHAAEGHQIMLELEEWIPFGVLTHTLESVNGVSPAESEYVQ